MKKELKVLVCFMSHYLKFGIDKAGGMIFNLNEHNFDDLIKKLSCNNDWMIVDNEYHNNLLLSAKDSGLSANSRKGLISEYLEKHVEKTDSKERWPKKVSCLK